MSHCCSQFCINVLSLTIRTIVGQQRYVSSEHYIVTILGHVTSSVYAAVKVSWWLNGVKCMQ